MTGEVLFVVQATLCIGAGLAASYLFRSRAAMAHQVLLAGLLMSVVMPCLTLLVGHFGIGFFVSETDARPDVTAMTWEPAEVIGSVPPGPETQPGPAVAILEEPPPIMDPVQKPASSRLPWDIWIGPCWIVATAVLLGRLVLRFILGLHLVRSSRDVPHEALHGAAETARAKLGIARPVHVRSGRGVSTPILWGWTREPVVLVSVKAGPHAAREDWVGLFCHELAHWKRLDHFWSLFAELVVCLFPWHPLAWWARTRLTRLSEHVCDDWVLACGRPGVDYAELLLELSPQSSVTLLPALVGKGHTMKERIQRIVAGQYGNPRVGRSWTLGLGTLAVVLVVGVAFAQERPAGSEGRPSQEQRPRQEQQKRQDLATAGRRNVLKRMLKPLQNQLLETEKVLAERPEARGEEVQILRSEQAALREQIGRIETQLRNLDRGTPKPIEAPLARQADEQAVRLQELRLRAEKIQDRLQGLDDKEGDQARALREELNGVREKIAGTERQMQESRRQRKDREVVEQEQLRADRGPRDEAVQRRPESLQRDPLRRMPNPIRQPGVEGLPNRVVRPRGVETRMENPTGQAVRVYKLKYANPERLAGIVRPLTGGMVTADERTGSLIVSTNESNHARIEHIIKELDTPGAGPQRDRPQADRAIETQVADLRGQVKGLNEKMLQMQRLLEQLLQQRPEGNPMQETLDQLLRQNPEPKSTQP